MNGPQATFFGRLTQDPGELRFTQNAGTPYITASVAVNTYRGAEEETETHYFNVTLWGRNAENLLNRCRKGQEVYIQGQYSFREFTRRDGTKGYSHDVNAREFHHYQERLQPRETAAEEETEEETKEKAIPTAKSPAESVESAASVESGASIESGEPLADPFGERDE